MTARRAGVVVNPSKLRTLGPFQAHVDATFARAGWKSPIWRATTREEPGRAAARDLATEVDLVCAAGGDGTVTACAEGLAGSGVPLAVLPAGTGNLLARNLSVPVDLDGALAVAVGGKDVPLDLGVVDEHRFAVMAGMGIDAAVMRDAPEGLKRRLGWPAYLVAGVRHLRGRRFPVTLTLDGGEPLRREIRSVLVGNVGVLQGGVPLLPEARPDDGLLDVVLVSPRGLLGWVGVVARVLRRRGLRGEDAPDPRLERHRARHVEVVADTPHPRQIDGDVLPPGRVLTVGIDAGAVLIRVPR